MAVSFSRAVGCIAVIALLCRPTVPLQAQTSAVTLQTIIDSARSHLPVLAQKKALINSAAAQKTFLKHSFLPSATVADEISVNTDNSLPGSYWSLGIIPSTSGGIRPTNNYQPATGNIGVLYSQYDLEDFGYKSAVLQNAEANKNVAVTDLAREEYTIGWQTAQLYFTLARAQYQLAVDSENVKRYQDVYSVIQAVTQSGIKAGADSSLALAELSKTRINYNQTLGDVRQLQQELAYLSGLPAQSISLDENNIPLGDSASGDRILNDATSKLTQLSTSPLGAGYAGGGASPLTDYYQKQKELYLSAENLVKKSYLPRIFLSGDLWVRGSSIDADNNYKSLATGLGYQRMNYMAGLTITYDLFNGLHKKDRLAVARYQTQASDEALKQEQQDLQNVSNKADEAIKTAYANLQEIPVQIKAAQDSYNQKTAQYKAGIINLIDLTNASYVLYRAETDYVQALSSWNLANLDKAAATGNLYTFTQLIK